VEKIEASTGNAKVTDYRRKLENGSDNPNYGKEVNVPYDVAAFDVVSTFDEVTKEFSQAQLISMAQSRQKATANSAARQKAVAQYAPTGDDLARENFIKSAMQMNSKLTREQAEAFADSMLATA
jgi:hypothetical protein